MYVCVWEWGKHFPGRIPGTRRRAGFSRWRRGCVPGSQLAACIYTTNGAPTVSPALTRARTHHSWVYPLCAHQHTPTQGQRDGEGGRERERKRPAICWSGTLQILTHWLYQKHKHKWQAHKVTKSRLLNTAAVKQTWIPVWSSFALNRRDHGKRRSISETISQLTEMTKIWMTA